MPLKYRLDRKRCHKIFSNPIEVSMDDLEWIRETCNGRGIADREIPAP